MIRAVKEHASTGTVAPGTYDVFMRSMVGDLARWRLQERITKQVLTGVVEAMTTRVSLNSIAKRTEMGSHNTISRYIEALEDSFVLRTVYQLDLAKGRPKYRSERKVYFQDPFQYHAARGWVRGAPDLFELSRDAIFDPVEKGRLVEMVVGEHLARLVGDLKPGDFIAHHESLLHWRKKGSEREVDFVIDAWDGRRPVEVKYQGSISGRDIAGLRAFQGGVVVSKDTLETRNGHAIVPAELFLALF
jgi:predicted AAA+ superfamily ATPase